MTNAFVGQITPSGSLSEFDTGGGLLNFPLGIAAGPDGNVWFTVNHPSQVGRITPAGVVTMFDVSGASNLAGIAAGPDGNLWFSKRDWNLEDHPDRLADRIPRPWSERRRPELHRCRSRRQHVVHGRGPLPGDRGDHTGWRRHGVQHGDGRRGDYPPFDIAAGPDGNMWFTSPPFSTPVAAIGRITPSGAITVFTSGFGPNSDPSIHRGGPGRQHVVHR